MSHMPFNFWRYAPSLVKADAAAVQMLRLYVRSPVVIFETRNARLTDNGGSRAATPLDVNTNNPAKPSASAGGISDLPDMVMGGGGGR